MKNKNRLRRALTKPDNGDMEHELVDKTAIAEKVLKRALRTVVLKVSSDSGRALWVAKQILEAEGIVEPLQGFVLRKAFEKILRNQAALIADKSDHVFWTYFYEDALKLAGSYVGLNSDAK
jgi:hypothetical protein